MTTTTPELPVERLVESHRRLREERAYLKELVERKNDCIHKLRLTIDDLKVQLEEARYGHG